MTKVTIIDYGVGNLLSLKMSLEFLGAEVVISRDERVIENSSHIILPGVGAFPKAMELIKSLNLDKHLIRAKNKGTFILGICLGMQLLTSESEEFGLTKGLNFIEGKVLSIKKSNNFREDIKIPNIGWFNIHSKENTNVKDTLFNNITIKDTFYFVHSYMLDANKNNNSVLYTIDYSGIEIPSVVMKNNIIGCQFHPEISGKSGLKFLNFFLSIK